MKALVWLGALVSLGSLLTPPRPDEPVTLIVSGHYQGHLTPCGCTRPMSGGLRRLATFVANTKDSVWIDTGGWVSGGGQQDRLKADAVADVLGRIGVTAVTLTSAEQVWGQEQTDNLRDAIGQPWLTASTPRIERSVWLGAGSGQDDEPERLKAWLAAQPAATHSVWVTPRPKADALRLRGAEVVVYRSEGSPEAEPVRAGGTWYITPGSKGKMAVSLTLGTGGVQSYRRVELTEEFPDEARASEVFSTYLDRVKEARLVEKLPRRSTEGFSGSERCGSCHASALASWKSSKHAHALQTLEKLNEDRDPDCLPCHVVGLSSEKGFRDRRTTPALADVGCEACHGPQEAHSADPYHTRVPRVQLSQCRSCHNADNSPEFDPQKAWKTISHGGVDNFLNRSRRTLREFK